MPTVIANRLQRIIICALGVFLLAPAASGQTPPASEQTQAIDAAAGTAQPSGQVATLTYANRPIVQFRATVMSRTPAERVIGANYVLARLVDEHPGGIVGTSVLGEARVVNIDGRVVFVILPQDVDVLIDETIDRKTEAAAAQLQLAYNEVVELRTPSRLVRAVGLAIVATLVYFVVLVLLVRGHRASARRLSETAQRRIERLPGGEIISRASRATELVRHLTAIVWMLLALLVTDMWLTFVLRRFPYTRPWGESMRASALHLFGSIGEMFVNALPGLGTVVLIVLITRIFTRLAGALFDAVDRRSVALPGIYPETAQPTRRIVVALLWLFALIVSYGYLPGSDSDAFKGASVFVGLIVSLGSTGIMNQIMSGFTITYSRALRVGDFVKVGDVEGTVTHIGPLATKIKTPHRVEVTMPNAIVISNATINYSRDAETGVYVHTTVTIGYDAPWRQVRALLLAAAERTPGIRSDPKPEVLQAALQDFFVEYRLLVSLERPHHRGLILDALHANIQDEFNEAGVQIMSPHYETDPHAPKLVPRADWQGIKPPADPDQPESARGKTKSAGAP